MFHLFRSQKKTVKYLLTALLGAVALSMVITLIPGLFSTPTVDAGAGDVLVEVGDEAVTAADVLNALRDYAQSGQVPADSLAFMARNIIDNQITDTALLQEAERLGVTPNERELAEWIRDQMPFLWEGGSFNSQQYQMLIQQRFRISVPQFEENLRKQIALEMRLKQLVTDNILMTEDEVRKAFEDRNETTKIRYATVNLDRFRAQVKPTEEQLRSYFDSNKFRYSVQEKRSVIVATVDGSAIEAPQFSDSELRNFYDQNRYRFETQERVMASHILFMTMDKPEEEVQGLEAKANEVLEQIKAGGDFAALAKENSEDPGTKDNGGDLGWVTRGQTEPNFETAAFGLEPGQTSDVIKTEYGYHIIKVAKKETAQLRSFDEVRDEIVADLRIERDVLARNQLIDDAVAKLTAAEPAQAEQTVREMGLPVSTYVNFDRGQPPPELAQNPSLTGAVFSAQPGDVLPSQDGDVATIVVVTDVTPGRDGTYEESAARVRADFVDAEARKLAEAQAGEIAAQAKSAGGLEKVARQFGLKLEESDYITRRDSVEGFTSAETLGDRAFNAEPGSVFGPVNTGEGYGLFEVVDTQPADMTLFAEQRTEIRAEFMQAKQDEAYQIYKALTRQQYEEQGKIKLYQNRIDQFVRQIARG